MAQHHKTASQDIALAAYRLFLANGYDGTSYRHIAEAVGRDRTVVQYHYPRKDALVVSMLDRVIALIEQYLVGHGFARADSTGYRVALAQLYFAFLLQGDIRQFTLDVLSRRAITRELSALDADWNATFLAASAADRQEIVRQGILAIGGAYELIYEHVLTGEPLDASGLARQTVINSLVPRHASSADVASARSVRLLNDPELALALREVRAALLLPS